MIQPADKINMTYEHFDVCDIIKLDKQSPTHNQSHRTTSDGLCASQWCMLGGDVVFADMS